MQTEKTLLIRAESKCELCSNTESLRVYPVPPSPNDDPERSILVCDICCEQMENPNSVDINHWRCLNESMWSQVPAVQVMAWRMLTRLRAEGWPEELLDMLYLDEEMLAWARSTEEDRVVDEDVEELAHTDSNGIVLSNGDTVILIKDLNVKGAGFTAKRGTAVRGISLVTDNIDHIEGRVNGQQIIILTKFVKKSG